MAFVVTVILRLALLLRGSLEDRSGHPPGQFRLIRQEQHRGGVDPGEQLLRAVPIKPGLFVLGLGVGHGSPGLLDFLCPRTGQQLVKLRLSRPLLGFSKSELVAHCEAAGVAYARDPSNEDPRYARTRLRALMGTLAAEGLDAPALVQT